MSDLILVPAADCEGAFRLASDWSIKINGKLWVVPKGTLTNGASIPSYLKPFFKPFHPHYTEASVLHDYLTGEWDGKPKVDWGEAANVMGQVMEANGSPNFKVWLFKASLLVYGKTSGKY